MAGTKEGGAKARATNLKKYGKDYYANIGRKGGQKGTTGGFYHSMENGLSWHIEAGRKGGSISRRTKKA